MPLPRGYIHVYDPNIQTFSLKPLGQSKPKFTWIIVRKGDESLNKWSRSHGQNDPHGYK